HFIELATGLAGFEIGDGLLMVPAREDGRDGEELSAMRKRRLGPRLENDLVRFLVVGAIALLVLDRCERPTEYFRLAGLVSASDPEFEPASAQHIEHRGLFRDSQRMPPRHDVRRLAEPNLRGPRGNRRFRKQRVRAELGAFRLKMMLGHKEVVE